MMKPYYEEPNITIYHGDCRDILPSLLKVDLVLTDPPYGIGFGAKHTKWSANRGTVLGVWDKKIEVNFILSAGKTVCIWGGDRFSLPVSRKWLAWIKTDAPPTFSGMELAWTNIDGPSRWKSHSISATNAERVAHPTQKPLKIMQWSIFETDEDALTILDPFMGSGTTLRAAKDLGRKAIGIEIEEKYCEIAVKRLAQEVLF
jgi:site-specific DNA-methyltransferase (adenine-specific)